MTCKDILACPGSPEFWNDDWAFRKSVIALLANVADDISVTVDSVSIEAGTAHIGEVSVSNFPVTQPVSGTVAVSSDTTIGDGRKTVTNAGTREALATTTACKRVDVQALSTNTGTVVVGGSTVVAAAGTRRGVALEAKQTYSFSIDDLAKVYVDTTVNGEGVNFTYFN